MKNINEEWRNVKGFEGLYEVSNLGNVRSLDRISVGRHREPLFIKGRVLSPIKRMRGYLEVNLVDSASGKRRVAKKIHRLVAEAFIENPNHYEQVNHRDENKHNNAVNNLEWCSAKYNNNYGTRNIKISETKRKHKIMKEELKNVCNY